jgi:hypothetical protein
MVNCQYYDVILDQSVSIGTTNITITDPDLIYNIRYACIVGSTKQEMVISDLSTVIRSEYNNDTFSVISRNNIGMYAYCAISGTAHIVYAKSSTLPAEDADTVGIPFSYIDLFILMSVKKVFESFKIDIPAETESRIYKLFNIAGIV